MTVTKLRPTFTFDQERLDALQTIAPEAFADGQINWDVLKEALGEHLEEEGAAAEHFGLTWPGKRAARRLASQPSAGTLLPAPGEGVNEATTRNIFIEGDNLEVLKLLQKSYAGRVKMIYIDPPYNTGQDFVYHDDFRQPLEEYLRLTGQMDEAGLVLTTNTKADGRFHSSWLSMMYPRLRLARSLLSADGVVFVSIDDNEIHNLRQLMNEVFGEEHFVDCIVWKKRYGGGAKEKYLVTVHEYVLFYARDIDNLDPLFVPQTEQSIERYYKLRDENYDKRGPYRTHPLEATKSMGDRRNLVFPIVAPDGSEIMPRRQWLWSRERVREALERGEIAFLKDKDGRWAVHTKQYLRDEDGNIRQSKAFSLIDDIYTQHGTNEVISLFGDAQVFAFPKPSEFVKRLLDLGTLLSGDDIVLDFFAGSCATAQAVVELNRSDGGNRRFIMVQLPEPTPPDSQARRAGFSTIAEVGKERIRRIIKRMQGEQQEKLIPDRETPEDLGFRVLKLGRSHFKAWQDYTGGDVAELETLFDRFESPLAEGSTPDDLLVEVMLLQGFPLDSTVTPMPEYQHNRVLRVASDLVAHQLYVCLDERLHPATADTLALGAEDVFVCLDSALDEDTKLRLQDGRHVMVI